jgi:hypothetical protein
MTNIQKLKNIELKDIGVLCLSNYAADSSMLRRALMSQGGLVDGSFVKPFYYSVGDTKGAVILINSSNRDVRSIRGRKTAKEQFVKALDYVTAVNPSIVVLLAAGLKRLFGRYLEEEIGQVQNSDGDYHYVKQTLRDRYPKVLFTNGDNGTSVLLIDEVKEVIKKADIRRGIGKICILGAGLLGTEVLKFLLSEDLEDYQINIISSFSNELRDALDNQRNITIFDNIDDVDTNIDFLICCSNGTQLTAELADLLNIRYVVDVSVPPAFVENEYFKTEGIYRQDAGNAYNKYLEYYFDSSILDLSENNIFGCFAEATALACNRSDELLTLNLFAVNKVAQQVVSGLFEKAEFSMHPIPLCFGVSINELVLV